MKKPVSELYEALISGDLSVDGLDGREVHAVFEYMCEMAERGETADEKLFGELCERIDSPAPPAVESVFAKVYGELSAPCPSASKKASFRRLLISVLAAAVFAVFSIGTASALGIDVVGKMKVIFDSEAVRENAKKEYTISFTRIIPDSYNGNVKKTYSDFEKLFRRELNGFMYPTEFPDGVEPFEAAAIDGGEDKLFYVKMKSDKSEELWQFFAKPSSESYLPMGYGYKAEIGGTSVDFVYTVARKNGEITRYSVYTVYNGVQYTFYLYTSEWEDVKTVLDSVKLP